MYSNRSVLKSTKVTCLGDKDIELIVLLKRITNLNGQIEI